MNMLMMSRQDDDAPQDAEERQAGRKVQIGRPADLAPHALSLFYRIVRNVPRIARAGHLPVRGTRLGTFHFVLQSAHYLQPPFMMLSS